MTTASSAASRALGVADHGAAESSAAETSATAIAPIQRLSGRLGSSLMTCRHDLLTIQADRVADEPLGGSAALHPADADRLVLEHLVVEEEPLELLQAVRRQLRDVAVVRVLRIVRMDRDDLVIGALVVDHRHHAEDRKTSCRERVWISVVE